MFDADMTLAGIEPTISQLRKERSKLWTTATEFFVLSLSCVDDKQYFFAYVSTNGTLLNC